MDVITPAWPAPANVLAKQTTRHGGTSSAPYASLNLGLHVGDDATVVEANRDALCAALNLPTTPVWLEQVHGTQVLMLPNHSLNKIADAVVSRTPGQVCAVMSADCLPVLFCDKAGTVVAAAHAGWRGLAAGVLEATLAAMAVDPAQVLVWLGPAIGPRHFEVGGEVQRAFIASTPHAESAFIPSGVPDKWLADLYQLARIRLQAAGVADCYGGSYCTYSEPEQFFSYRREQKTGRMASLIWLK